MENTENNKKNKTLLIVGIILVIILLGIGGYLLLAKDKKEDKPVENTNTNSNTNVEVGQLDVKGDLVQGLMNSIKSDDMEFYRNQELNFSNLSEKNKFSFAFKRLDGKGITVSCNMDSFEGMDTSEIDMQDCWIMDYEIEESIMNEAFQKAFGKDVTPTKTTNPIEFYLCTDLTFGNLTMQKDLNSDELFCGVASSTIRYDANKKSYVGEFSTSGGGEAASGNISKLLSATQGENGITITEKVIFVDIYPEEENPTEYVIYADMENKKKIGTIGVNEFDISKDNSNLVDQYMDKAMTVIYTFAENEDGSYHFVSSKMTN